MQRIALLLLPVHSGPDDYSPNGFEAPAKKRKRAHAHTAARRKPHTMTEADFDKKCRSIAQAEIIKAVRVIESHVGGQR